MAERRSAVWPTLQHSDPSARATSFVSVVAFRRRLLALERRFIRRRIDVRCPAQAAADLGPFRRKSLALFRRALPDLRFRRCADSLPNGILSLVYHGEPPLELRQMRALVVPWPVV